MQSLHEMEVEAEDYANERPQLLLSPGRNRRGDGAFSELLPNRYPYTSFSPHTPEHSVFSLKESEQSPAFLPLLLLLSGDRRQRNQLRPQPLPMPDLRRAIFPPEGGQFPVLFASRKHIYNFF